MRWGCIDPEKTLEHSSLDLGISAQSSSIVLPFLQGLRQVYMGLVLKRKRWRRVYEPVLVSLNYHHLFDAVSALWGVCLGQMTFLESYRIVFVESNGFV